MKAWTCGSCEKFIKCPCGCGEKICEIEIENNNLAGAGGATDDLECEYGGDWEASEKWKKTEEYKKYEKERRKDNENQTIGNRSVEKLPIYAEIISCRRKNKRKGRNDSGQNQAR